MIETLLLNLAANSEIIESEFIENSCIISFINRQDCFKSTCTRIKSFNTGVYIKFKNWTNIKLVIKFVASNITIDINKEESFEQFKMFDNFLKDKNNDDVTKIQRTSRSLFK